MTTPRRRRSTATVVPLRRGLGEKPQVLPSAAQDPAVIVREVERLAVAYDAAQPPMSFSRWAAEQGAGDVVEAYKRLAREAGATDVLAALDEEPPAEVPAVEPGRYVISPGFAAAIDELRMQYMMTGQEPPIPEAYAGEDALAYVTNLWFASQSEQAAVFAQQLGIPADVFKAHVERINTESQRARRKNLNPLVKAVHGAGKVAEFLADNPAVFFGAPFVVAALTGAFAASAAAAAPASTTTAVTPVTTTAATAPAATTATTAATTSAGGAAAGAAVKTTALAKAAAVAPKVVTAINAARTIDAIASGEVPPPPLSLEGDSFLDWAQSIGMSVLEGELQQQMTAAQRAQAEAAMRAQVAEYQRQMLAQGPIDYRDPRAAGISETALDTTIAAQLRDSEQQNRWLLYGLFGALALYALTR